MINDPVKLCLEESTDDPPFPAAKDRWRYTSRYGPKPGVGRALTAVEKATWPYAKWD